MDGDRWLRRLERTAVGICVMMAAAALVIARGGIRAPLSVLGGGLLILISYRTLALGVAALMPDSAPGRTRRLLALTGRYALLALLAYVMIARLRMHPLALLAGVSSVPAAASIEAFRLLLKKKF